ncbi:kelch repeat-containing protein, partial [Bdellovibrionota bacterium FG-2]
SQLSPLELIKGISIDAKTGIIGGTALEFLNKSLYAIVNAKNTDGEVIASSLIALNLSLPQNTPIAYGGGLLTFPLGEATEFSPTMKVAFDTFSISPALPEGIALDPTGKISGTPKVFSPTPTTHVVVASDKTGKNPSAITAFTIKLIDVPPLSFAYSYSQSLYVIGKQILSNNAHYEGGAAQFSSPCFEGATKIAGLSLDPVTAKISGTPTQAFDTQECTITAQNSGGALSIKVKIGVLAKLPTLGALGTPRFDHSATLLKDGRVLIVGGCDASIIMNTAEIFDPQTGHFTPTGSMTYPRHKHQAVLLSDGKVAIIGGTGTDFDPVPGAAKTIEIYDPASGAFSKSIIEMTVKRTTPGATLMTDGRVYITGGNIDGSTEIYDPFKKSSSLSRVSAAAHDYALYSAAVTLDTASNEVLFIGGLPDPASPPASSPAKPVDLFTPTANTFSTTAALTQLSTEFYTLTALPGGKYLFAGGLTTYSAYNSSCMTVVIGDTTDARTLLTNGTNRASHTANLMPDEKTVFLLGGISTTSDVVNGGASLPDSTTCEDYDYGCETVTQALAKTADIISLGPSPATPTRAIATSTLVTARRNHTATLLQSGTILVVGGAIVDLKNTIDSANVEYYP